MMAFQGTSGSSPDQDCASYLMSLKFSRPVPTQPQASAAVGAMASNEATTNTISDTNMSTNANATKRTSPKRIRPQETTTSTMNAPTATTTTAAARTPTPVSVPVSASVSAPASAPAPAPASTVMRTPSPVPLATNQDPRHLSPLECHLRAKCCELFVVSPEDVRNNTYSFAAKYNNSNVNSNKFPHPVHGHGQHGHGQHGHPHTPLSNGPHSHSHAHGAYPNMHMSMPGPGTVGIRCAYCSEAHNTGSQAAAQGSRSGSHSPVTATTTGNGTAPAVAATAVFPTSLADIYRSVEQMKLGHFHHCPHIPPNIKNQIVNDCIMNNGKNSPLSSTTSLHHMERSIEDQIRESCKQQYWVDSAKDLGLVDDYSYDGHGYNHGPHGGIGGGGGGGSMSIGITLAPGLPGFVRNFDPALFQVAANVAVNTPSMNGHNTAFASAVAVSAAPHSHGHDHGHGHNQFHMNMDIPNAALNHGHRHGHPGHGHPGHGHPGHGHGQYGPPPPNHMMHNPNHNYNHSHNHNHNPNNKNNGLYMQHMPMTKRQPITGQNLSDYDVYDQEPRQHSFINLPQSEERFEKLMGNTELVDLSDRQYIPDYIFLAMAQLKPCTVVATDRIGTYKNRDIGFKGMCCKHCGGEPGFGRYFPETVRSLSQTTTSQTIVKHVAYKCLKCPREVRDAVKELKILQETKDKAAKAKRRSRFDERPKYGSRKVFFQHLWARLHGEGDLNTSSDSTKNKDKDKDKNKNKKQDKQDATKTKKGTGNDKSGKEGTGGSNTTGSGSSPSKKSKSLTSSSAEPLSERKRTRTVSPGSGSFDDVDATASHYPSSKPPHRSAAHVNVHGMKRQMIHHSAAATDASSQENRSRFVSFHDDRRRRPV